MQSSFYSLAQLTTAFAWGVVSDRYGRKQLIVMSNLSSTISMLMFGLAGNYVMAALSRAIGGWCVSPYRLLMMLFANLHLPPLLQRTWQLHIP